MLARATSRIARRAVETTAKNLRQTRNMSSGASIEEEIGTRDERVEWDRGV